MVTDQVPTIGNYINGRWTTPGGTLIDVTNPATGGVLARVALSSAADVDAVSVVG